MEGSVIMVLVRNTLLTNWMLSIFFTTKTFLSVIIFSQATKNMFYGRCLKFSFSGAIARMDDPKTRREKSVGKRFSVIGRSGRSCNKMSRWIFYPL